MRRIAYALTGLLALALCVVGSPPAHATSVSTECENGTFTEVTLLDDPSPVYLGVEFYTGEDRSFATLCYKDNTGVTNTGGFVHLVYQPAQQRVIVWCVGDLPATVAVNCFSYADVDTTDPDPSSTGSAVTGWVRVEGFTGTVPLTGAEAGGIGTSTASGTSATGAGTCAWVLGQQVLSSCGGALVGARLVYQAVPVVTTEGVPACAGLFVGGTCVGVWATVPVVDNAYFVGDGGPTATVTVVSRTVSTPDQHEPGCLGFDNGTDPRCYQ